MLASSENVFGSKLKLKAVEGCRSNVEGKEKAPRDGNCDAKGMLITGAGSLEITKVEFITTDPDSSLAVRPISTPVIVPDPTSFIEGVPKSVRVSLFRDSQLGAVDNV